MEFIHVDCGCHFGSHFENRGHFVIFSAKFGLVDVKKTLDSCTAWPNSLRNEENMAFTGFWL